MSPLGLLRCYPYTLLSPWLCGSSVVTHRFRAQGINHIKLTGVPAVGSAGESGSLLLCFPEKQREQGMYVWRCACICMYVQYMQKVTMVQITMFSFTDNAQTCLSSSSKDAAALVTQFSSGLSFLMLRCHPSWWHVLLFPVSPSALLPTSTGPVILEATL